MDSHLPSRRDKHRRKGRSLPTWFPHWMANRKVETVEFPTPALTPKPELPKPEPPKPQPVKPEPPKPTRPSAQPLGMPPPEQKPAVENELTPDPQTTGEWPLFRPPQKSGILDELVDAPSKPDESDFVVFTNPQALQELDLSTPSERAERLIGERAQAAAQGAPPVEPLREQKIDWRRLRRRRRIISLFMLGIVLLGGAATGLLAWADWQVRLVPMLVHYAPPVGSGDVSARLSGDRWEVAAAGDFRGVRWRGLVYANRRPAVAPDDHQKIDDILRDFQAIAELKANLLIVPSLQPPQFYRALRDWNQRHKDPLYLIQILAPAAHAVLASGNLQDQATQAAVRGDLQASVQALKGQLSVAPAVDGVGGTYESDVSPYVAGMVLDLPWERLLAVDGHPWNGVQTTLDQLDRNGQDWRVRAPIGLLATPEYTQASAGEMRANAGFFLLAPMEPGTLAYATAGVKQGMDLAPATYLAKIQQQWPRTVILPVVGERTGPALVRYGQGAWTTYAQDADAQATALAGDLAALTNTPAGVAVQQFADDWSETAYGTTDLRLPPSRRSAWYDPFSGGNGLNAWQPGGKLVSLAPTQPLSTWQKANLLPVVTRAVGGTPDPYGEEPTRRLEALYAHPAADGLDVLVQTYTPPAVGNIAMNWANTHLLLAFDSRTGGNAHLPYPHLPTLDTGWETVVEIGREGAQVWSAAHADPVTWLWGQQRHLLPVPLGASREDGDRWISALLPIAPALGRLPTLTRGMQDGITWMATPEGEVRMHIPWLALGVMDPSSAAVPNQFWESGRLADRSLAGENLRMAALTYRPDEKGAPAAIAGDLWISSSLPSVTDGYLAYAALAQVPWPAWDNAEARIARRPAFGAVQAAFAAMAP